MQIRLDYPPLVVPLQRVERERPRPRHILEPVQPDGGPVVGEGALRGIPRLRPLDQTRPIVGVPDHPPESHIITPPLELADRRIPRRQQRTELGVLDGSMLNSQPCKPLINQTSNMPVKQAGTDGRSRPAADPPARVGDVAMRVDRSLQGGPALGAPGYPRQQPVMMAPVVVADTTDLVRGLPQLAGDDRRPRIRILAAARTSEMPERRTRLHDPDDGGVRPPFATVRGRDTLGGEQTGDLPPSDPSGTQLEDAADHRGRDRVRLNQPLRGAPVAERGADHVPARGVRFCHRGSQVLVGLVALPLGHDQQQPEHRPPHRRRRVDALGDGHDPGAALVQLVDRRQPTDHGAGEPVKTGDDDPRARPRLDAFESVTHPRPVHRAAGPVEVLVDAADTDPVGLRPAFDRVTLRGRGLEPFAASPADLRHADIAVHHRSVGHRPGIYPVVGSWGVHDKGPDKARGRSEL